MCVVPLERSERAGEPRERLRDLGEAVDEAPVVRRQSEEAAHARRVLGPRPRVDRARLVVVDAQAVLGHDAAQELDRRLADVALGRLEAQAGSAQDLEERAQAADVGRADRDVVEVSALGQVAQDRVHEALERRRRRREPERHDDELVKAERRDERRLRDVLGRDGDLPVARAEVQRREGVGAAEGVHEVFHERHREGVLDGHGVQPPVVDAEPVLAVLAPDQHNGCGPRRTRGPHDAGRLHLVHEAPQDVALRGGHAVGRQPDGRRRAGRDAVKDAVRRVEHPGRLQRLGENVSVLDEEHPQLLPLRRLERRAAQHNVHREHLGLQTRGPQQRRPLKCRVVREVGG